MTMPRMGGLVKRLPGYVVWLVVVIATTLPIYAAMSDWSNQTVRLWLYGLTGVVVLTAAILIAAGSKLAWPLPQAGEFIREIGRARYVTLVAAIFATFCALLVLLSAILTVSIDTSEFNDPLTQSQNDLRPAKATSRAEQRAADLPLEKSGDDRVRSDEKKWQEQIPSAVEAFLGAFATILAIGMFYRRLAPYTDLWELVAEISYDMERLYVSTTKSKEIWWCYPGLALGRFRSLNKDGTQNSEQHLFEAFKASLVQMLVHSEIKLHAVVYDEDCLDSFYRAYSLQTQSWSEAGASPTEGIALSETAKILNEHEPDIRISCCIDSEKELIGHCVAAGRSSTSIYKVRKPDAMPPFVIVIGSVVYQIANYGSPIFVPCDTLEDWPESSRKIKGLFMPSTKRGSERLLQLIAYRRDDIAFAKAVVGHIERHISAAKSAGLIH